MQYILCFYVVFGCVTYRPAIAWAWAVLLERDSSLVFIVLNVDGRALCLTSLFDV